MFPRSIAHLSTLVLIAGASLLPAQTPAPQTPPRNHRLIPPRRVVARY